MPMDSVRDQREARQTFSEHVGLFFSLPKIISTPSSLPTAQRLQRRFIFFLIL